MSDDTKCHMTPEEGCVEKVIAKSTPLQSDSVFEKLWRGSRAQYRAREIETEVAGWVAQLRAAADYLERKSQEIPSAICEMNPSKASDTLSDLDIEVEDLAAKVEESVAQCIGFASGVEISEPERNEIDTEADYFYSQIRSGLGIPNLNGDNFYSTASMSHDMAREDFEAWRTKLSGVMDKWRRARGVFPMFPIEHMPNKNRLYYTDFAFCLDPDRDQE